MKFLVIILVTFAVSYAVATTEVTANLADAPFVTSVLNGEDLLCVGAYHTDNAVITAAQCLGSDINPSNLTVRAGSLNWSSGGQLVNVNDVVIHPNYSIVNGYPINNIAVLTLAENITNENVTAIGLATTTVPEGTTATLFGWGSESSLSDELTNTNITILSSTLCSVLYGSIVSNDTLCTDLGSNILSQGSSNSLLVADNELIGIESFGDGLSLLEPLGVATSIDNYVEWINSTISNL